MGFVGEGFKQWVLTGAEQVSGFIGMWVDMGRCEKRRIEQRKYVGREQLLVAS